MTSEEKKEFDKQLKQYVKEMVTGSPYRYPFEWIRDLEIINTQIAQGMDVNEQMRASIPQICLPVIHYHRSLKNCYLQKTVHTLII